MRLNWYKTESNMNNSHFLFDPYYSNISISLSVYSIHGTLRYDGYAQVNNSTISPLKSKAKKKA